MSLKSAAWLKKFLPTVNLGYNISSVLEIGCYNTPIHLQYTIKKLFGDVLYTKVDIRKEPGRQLIKNPLDVEQLEVALGGVNVYTCDMIILYEILQHITYVDDLMNKCRMLNPDLIIVLAAGPDRIINSVDGELEKPFDEPYQAINLTLLRTMMKDFDFSLVNYFEGDNGKPEENIYGVGVVF